MRLPPSCCSCTTEIAYAGTALSSWHLHHCRAPADLNKAKLVQSDSKSLKCESTCSCLTALGGYECQEAQGDFMLSFHTAADAVGFCLKVPGPCMQASTFHVPGCSRDTQAHADDSCVSLLDARLSSDACL